MQHYLRKRRNSFTWLILLIVLCFSVASCTSGSDDGTGGLGAGGTCPKCIENKPAPTPFSTTLNAINHSIPLDQAVAMVNNFGVVRENMLAEDYRGIDALPVYETFNLAAIDELICQDNAIGFRVYMAMDDQNQARFVLVGVDGDGKDVVQRTNEDPAFVAAAANGVSVLVAEAGQRWP